MQFVIRKFSESAIEIMSASPVRSPMVGLSADEITFASKSRSIDRNAVKCQKWNVSVVGRSSWSLEDRKIEGGAG